MINTARYVINYAKLVTQRIPELLRFEDLIAFVQALVSPLVFIYNQFITFRLFIIYKLTITPQVVYMEKMLNDQYDSVLRRIYIKDGAIKAAVYLYTKAELKPKFLYTKPENKPIYLYTKGESIGTTFDFVVYVPSDISFNSVEMSTRINNYKLASKIYSIQIF